jgi:hypothetical protein
LKPAVFNADILTTSLPDVKYKKIRGAINKRPQRLRIPHSVRFPFIRKPDFPDQAEKVRFQAIID